MRIEILVGNDDPIIFPLKSSKVTLGSGESCDIVLPTGGISRKHLIISIEDDNYYVIDQGSTNGSFINEERLVPGRRVEFTSFFPVRLGDDVLISLIGDDEGEEVERIEFPSRDSSAPKKTPAASDESTRVINLKDLNSVKTESLVKKREEKRTEIKRRASNKPEPKDQGKKKPEAKSNRLNILIAVFLAAAAYYNFFVMKPEVEPEVAKVGEVVRVERPKPKPRVIDPLLIPAKDLPAVETYQRLINDIKCITDDEKYFCDTISGAKSEDGSWGVTQVGTMINVMVDGTQYIDEAKKLVKDYSNETEENKKLFVDHTRHVAAYVFFLKGIPANLDPEKLKGKTLSFALYEIVDGEKNVYVVLSITPKALTEFKGIAKPEFYPSLREPGTDVMALIKNYYQVQF